jgi:hypothetical protein
MKNIKKIESSFYVFSQMRVSLNSFILSFNCILILKFMSILEYALIVFIRNKMNKILILSYKMESVCILICDR